MRSVSLWFAFSLTSQLPFFQLRGTPKEDKKLLAYDSHIVPKTELMRETLAWLDHYLVPVK